MIHRLIILLAVILMSVSCQTTGNKSAAQNNEKTSSFTHGWQEGQYVTYLKTLKDNSWETYKVILYSQTKSGDWPFLVRVKSLHRDFLLLYHAKNTIIKGELPIKLVNYKSGRGPELTKEDLSAYYVFFLNVIKIRNQYSKERNHEEKKLRVVKRNFGHLIDEADEFIDAWPEFNYTRYYYCNDNVPVIGFAGITCSDNRFNLKLLSYGRNTFDLDSYRDVPTYINFYEFKKISYNDFEISYPADWFLDKKKFETKEAGRGQSGYVAIVGGNNHSGFLQLIKYTIDPAAFSSEVRAIREDYMKKAQKMGFLLEGTIDIKDNSGKKSSIYSFQYQKEGQTGFQVMNMRPARDRKSLVVITVFSNFVQYNPLKYRMEEYKKQAVKMISSFRFF